ncbi:hypothetical protein [Seleniivibrio woodruffii]|uniref:Glutaredoxin-related protein n=1 Tax=Seleniivibrio woodruffii TaxID=1078050 RepID=A0A4R1K3T2_9BACT|nr:hypothetical protein [Seleniivibrio woodruffii]TCK58363.1 hypothetical protein C8D98_2563 [Seleniivibrio woodruffii]TVZ36737.1 hypothetical protein OF66_2373 [Seleniivibrio woodruffii]
MSYKLDALLNSEFGPDRVDFKYVDVASPEILDYIDDIGSIVEGRLTLPYVTMNGEPLCWGLSDAGDIMTRLKLKQQQ